MTTKQARVSTLLFPIIALFLATSATADESERFYATASVGAGSLSSATLGFADADNTSSASADFETSFVGGGALGYRFDNGWTLEGELMYRRNELDPVSIPGLGDFEEGDFASLAIGVNALYRFSLGDSGRLQAFAGPGFVYLQEIDIDFDNGGQQEVSFETDDTAWQFKIGGRYDFSRRWFMDASATWLSASSVRMVRPENSEQSIESDYDHLAFAVGVGLRF